MPDSIMLDALLYLLLFPTGLMIALILGPVALGAACRRANLPVPRFRRRVWICVLSLLATIPVIIITLGLHRWVALLWLPLLAILVALLVTVLRYGPEGFALLPRRHTWAPTLVLVLAGACMTYGPMMALMKARTVQLRAVGLASLNMIGKAVFLYRTDYGQVPESLHQMETAGLAPAKITYVVADVGGHVDGPHGQDEPLKYTYFPLPNSAPGDLLRVFDWPAHHNEEGVFALYADGQVRWVPVAQFVVDLDKTYRWLLAQSAGPATSQPTTAPSQPTSQP